MVCKSLCVLVAQFIFCYNMELFFLILLSFPIKDIDIKKVNGVPQYAFVQYSDIASVCKAIKKMDGEYLGSNRLKVSSFYLREDDSFGL